jgi:hypothetical protein
MMSKPGVSCKRPKETQFKQNNLMTVSAVTRSQDPKFPILEDVLQMGTVNTVIREMETVCSILDDCPAKYYDLGMLNRIYTAGRGLRETINLLEKLRVLAQKKPKHMSDGSVSLS